MVGSRRAIFSVRFAFVFLIGYDVRGFGSFEVFLNHISRVMDELTWNCAHKCIYRGCNLFFGCWNIGYFSTFMFF